MSVPLTFLFDFAPGMPAMFRPYFFREFAEAGAKHLVLTDTLIKQICSDENLADILQKEMAAEGLTFVDAHAPFGVRWDMNCPDEYHKVMIARHKLNINIAASMNVDTITIHLGNDLDATPLEVHRRRIEDALAAILPEAEKCGVTVCIENIWFRCNTPEELLRYKELFPTDALGFCYDAGHANIMNNGRLHANSNAHRAAGNIGLAEPQWDDRILEKMLPHVVNCHIHDNDGNTDLHTVPGKGNVDWQKISSLLKQAPRLKCIQSEVLPVVPGTHSIREIVESVKKYF